MPSKKKLCRSWKLYVITDRAGLAERSLENSVRLAIQGGADVIQLRDKKVGDEELLRTANALLKITRAHGVPLIINDRVGVAKASGADGVHLGQEDGSLADARKVLGERAIIGRSTHSPEQAERAEQEGFDYIGIGPIFATPTKLNTTPVGLSLVAFASKNIGIPFVAIGGIDHANALEVKKAGGQCVAVVRAVMASKDPHTAAKAIKTVMV